MNALALRGLSSTPTARLPAGACERGLARKGALQTDEGRGPSLPPSPPLPAPAPSPSRPLAASRLPYTKQAIKAKQSKQIPPPNLNLPCG